MKKDNSKFTLSLPGEVAYDYSIKRNDSNETKEFNSIDNLLQYLYEVNKDQFNEHKKEKAHLLLDFYFSYFNNDYIDFNSWNYFVSTFNVENPRNKNFYSFESPDNKNKDVDPKQLLDECIGDSSINKSEIEKVSKLLLNKDNEYIHITTDYFCETTTDIFVATVSDLFKNKPNAVIKKCQNCGKLFIPKKRDAMYCEKISPQYDNKTCKQAMDVIKKNEALNDPIKRLHKNVYNTLYTSSANNSKENEKILKSFIKQNKVKQSKYDKGLITTEEYASWLRSFYKRK